MCPGLFSTPKIELPPEPAPLPTRADEDVKVAKRESLLAAAQRKGYASTIKNKGGAQGIGDAPTETKRPTLLGYA